MKKILIEKGKNVLKSVLLVNDKVEECYFEEDDKKPKAGQIYKGIVQNIVPGIKCAFIDIGSGRNAFMYMDNKFENMDIKKGQEVIVEVLKEEIGEKGAKVTNMINIAGRLCVFEPHKKGIFFSRKIRNDGFKKNILNDMKGYTDCGILIRTEAENADIDSIKEEVSHLQKIYDEIVRKAQYKNKPELLYNGKNLIDYILIDKVSDEIDEIVVSDKAWYEYIKNYLEKRNMSIKCTLYCDKIDLFYSYGIERQISSLINRKINLKCGGFIVIEKTEAAYVIDVNSGKNVKERNIEKTAYNTDFEAAEEIAKQIKLRNLSGIIIIDFIDLNNNNYKESIMKALEDSFRYDKNSTSVYPFTELNLVQITRRRRGKSIYEYIEEKCSECAGSGSILKIQYIERLIRNEILRICLNEDFKSIYIEMNKAYEEKVLMNKENFINNIGACKKDVYVRFLSNIKTFKVEPVVFENQIKKLAKFRF